jgi:low affinity Fe/Cu permease
VTPTEPNDAAGDKDRRRRWVEDRDDSCEQADTAHWYSGLLGQTRVGAPGTLAPSAEWESRPRASRMLHRGRAATTYAGAGAWAAVLLGVWLVIGLVFAFPHWWELVLYSVTSSITLLLVFALQHTGARQESATQRKLDELLRSVPQADNRLIAVEEAADDELTALSELNREDRARAREDPSRQSS